MKMKSLRLTAAVGDLMAHQSLLEKFRQNPDRALRGYRLSAEQIDAVKSGDMRSLTDRGLDLNLLYAPPPRGRRLLARIAGRTPWLVPALLSFGLWASPVAAVPQGVRRLRVRARMGRTGPYIRARAGGRTMRAGQAPRRAIVRGGIRTMSECDITCPTRTEFGGGLDLSSVSPGAGVRVGGWLRAGIRTRPAPDPAPPKPVPIPYPVVRGRVTIRARALGHRVQRTVGLPANVETPGLPIDLKTGKQI